MDRWDVLALIGLALLGAGLALIALWLGLVVVGVLVLAAGVFGSMTAERAAATRELIAKTGGR